VLAPGSRNGAPLASVLDVSEWKKAQPVAPLVVPGRPRARRQAAAETDDGLDEDDGAPGRPGRWRTVVASLLLLGAAAGAGLLAFRPQLWTPRLADAPWQEIALGLLASALLLLPGWNLGRILVRTVAVLAAIAALALMGPVVAQGADKLALLILACAWILAFALSVFLSRTLSTMASVLTLLVILGAGAAIGYLGYVPPPLGGTPPPAASAR
jgi:peptidoglycan/LPS O-acetylase OafA/YrhL